MNQHQVARDTASKWRVAGWLSLGGLVLIGIAALIVLIITWPSQHDTVRYELAKTSMQVLAVAFFGSLATLAAFTFQRSRAQADKQAERKRQDYDNYRDQRRREDDQLRSIMNETLTAYNRVKRIRRLLKAETLTAYNRVKQIRRIASGETSDGTFRSISLQVYDECMTGLIDEQLAFEKLKRFTPFISDKRLSPSPATDAARWDTVTHSETLTKTYEDIEKYLNHVIHEYEEKRHTVIEAGVPMVGFCKLSGFIGANFEPNVADKIDVIIKTLLNALWQPLEASTGERARTEG